MKFRKIYEAQISSGEVTLALKRADDGAPFGRVIAMMATHAGPQPMVTDQPIEEAIAAASELARSADRGTVYVVDDEDLWQSEWGSLER